MLGKNTAIVADVGYHSEDNLQGLSERGVDAWIADPQMRQRDERFADQGKHKARPDQLHDKAAKPTKPGTRFKPSDFASGEASVGRTPRIMIVYHRDLNIRRTPMRPNV